MSGCSPLIKLIRPHTFGELPLMPENLLEKIGRLERLAAWHRINAQHAGGDWVWEARLLAAEDLERQAIKIRSELFDGQETATELNTEGSNCHNRCTEKSSRACKTIKETSRRRGRGAMKPPLAPREAASPP